MGKKPPIIVIIDNGDFLRFDTFTLQKQGFTVKQVKTLREYEILLRKNTPFDVLIIDYLTFSKTHILELLQR